MRTFLSFLFTVKRKSVCWGYTDEAHAWKGQIILGITHTPITHLPHNCNSQYIFHSLDKFHQERY
jgi:hypothetical protein